MQYISRTSPWPLLRSALAPAALLVLGSWAAAQNPSTPATIDLNAVRGGPFGEQGAGQISLTLVNTTGADAMFEAVLGEPWLRVEPALLKLRHGASSEVKVYVDESAGLTLGHGHHVAKLAWLDVWSRTEIARTACNLHLSPMPARLSVAETAPGHYRLENEGDLPVTAQVRVDAPWAWVEGSAEVFVPALGSVDGIVIAGDLGGLELESGETRIAPVRFHAPTPDVPQNFPPGAAAPFGEVLVEGEFSMSGTVSGPGLLNGWTNLQRSVDTRTVYVSTSQGSDNNDGLSEQSPKRTIEAGKALLRHGFPDWLVLRRGDVFDQVVGQWQKSGRSAVEPMVLGTYGTSPERPILRTGGGVALSTHGGAGSPPVIEWFALNGLHFIGSTATSSDEPYAITLLQPVRGFLIEDCKIEQYSTGIIVQGFNGRHENVSIRRTIVTDCYDPNGGGNPQGLYVENSDGVLVEECTFHENGWQPDVSGADADIFSHNIYCDTHNSGVVLRGNVISRGASHGVQMRAGGLAVNNLFVGNTIALMMAGGSGPQQNTSRAIRNVILDGRDIDSNNHRGWGIDFNDVVGGVIRENIIANNVNGSFPLPILLDGGGFGGGVHNVLVEGNDIWDWGGQVYFTGDTSRLSGIVFRDNDLQDARDVNGVVAHASRSNLDSISSSGNRFYDAGSALDEWMRSGSVFQDVPQWKVEIGDTGSRRARTSYRDPWRTLADFHEFIGGPNDAPSLLQKMVDRPLGLWLRIHSAPGANAWIRQGFLE